MPGAPRVHTPAETRRKTVPGARVRTSLCAHGLVRGVNARSTLERVACGRAPERAADGQGALCVQALARPSAHRDVRRRAAGTHFRRVSRGACTRRAPCDKRYFTILSLPRRRARLRRRCRRRRAAFGGGWRGVVVAEDHALPRLARVDAEHRGDRNHQLLRHSAEARFERDHVVAEHQRTCRVRTHVQNDLAVLHVCHRNANAVALCVDDEMRREVVVHHPLVHRPQQVRALLGWGFGGYRSSRSGSVRLAWNDGRENTSSM